MANTSFISALPYQHSRQVLVSDDDQNVSKIMQAIKDNHNQERAVYDKFAGHFWKGNVKDTGRGLFSFLKKKVHYNIEPEEDQTVKTPGRLLRDQYGDCKHYAGFICGVADALQRKGLPVKCKYRFVSDAPGREIHHVFAVIEDNTGNEYWVDPVIHFFDQRPTFYNTKDIAMISKLSGTKYGLNETPPDMGIVAGVQMLRPEGVNTFIKAHGATPDHFQSPEHLANFLVVKAHENPRILFYVLHPSQISGTYTDAEIGNFFDDIGKGIKNTFNDVTKGVQKFAKGQETNLKNLGKEVKKFGKGQETNLRNLGKGIEKGATAIKKGAEHTIKDVGKGIEHAANEVKEVALKVALSAGRGPALAIISMNAFNWGKRVYDTIKSSPQNRAALLRKWNDIGGSPTALVNAANSGARKYYGSKWNTNMKVNGVGEISVAALMALAAGVLAILSKFIKSPTSANEPEIAIAAKEGVAQLAVEAAQTDGGKVAIPGYNDSYVTMDGGYTQGGNGVMTVNGGYYPDLAPYSQPPAGYSDIDVYGGGPVAPDSGSSFDGIIAHTITFFKKHKTLTFGAGAIAGGILLGSVLPGKKNKKYVVLGALAAGSGALVLVNTRGVKEY